MGKKKFFQHHRLPLLLLAGVLLLVVGGYFVAMYSGSPQNKEGLTSGGSTTKAADAKATADAKAKKAAADAKATFNPTAFNPTAPTTTIFKVADGNTSVVSTDSPEGQSVLAKKT